MQDTTHHISESDVSSLAVPVPIPDSGHSDGLTPDQPTAGDPVLSIDTAVEVADTTDISNQLSAALRTLQDKITTRLAHDPAGYRRAVADLEKTVDRLPRSRDPALQKCLHSFGKSVTQVIEKITTQSLLRIVILCKAICFNNSNNKI